MAVVATVTAAAPASATFITTTEEATNRKRRRRRRGHQIIMTTTTRTGCSDTEDISTAWTRRARSMNSSSSTMMMMMMMILSTILMMMSLSSSVSFLVNGECIESNTTLDELFAEQVGAGITGIPVPGSCCMKDVCGYECPVPMSEPAKGYGTAVTIVMVLSVVVGMSTYFFVNGSSVNFFVAGRSLPLWMVGISLAAQSLDTNALLGNVDLSYKFGFYDGAVIPIGLGLSLILNGIFLAHHVQADRVMTLPDVFAKRYGRVVEVLVSLITIISFIMLLAGNFVGFAKTTSYLWGVNRSAATWVAALLIWAYTECGGLLSVVYTQIFQACIGWMGLLVVAYWFIANDEDAPEPSIGYPGYIYPDTIGDGGVCDMYNGTACQYTPVACCYNIEQWCPGYEQGLTCERYDRGAYPTGDQQVYKDQMTNPYALNPYPNAILWNWATIFILGIGNLGALDFQARCMASKTKNIARIGCIMAGCITMFIGVPFAYLGAITRIYYGPDSVHSIYVPDSCQAHLGAPTCGLWKPDENAFLSLLTTVAPSFVGGWGLIGIIAASITTADGAILAMGTVLSNNIIRQFVSWCPSLVTTDNLLTVARISTIPVTVASASIAAYYQAPNGGGTGYLLIVAFDIVFATVVVPLFGCFYAGTERAPPSPRAALISILGGAATRVTLEFVLPKDGTFLLPFNDGAFYDVGPAASANPPAYIDTNQTHWDPTAEPCIQTQYEDFTGADSISSFLVSLILFFSIQSIEKWRGRPLFYFPGSEGYVKLTDELKLKLELQGGALGLPYYDESSSEEDENDMDVEFVRSGERRRVTASKRKPEKRRVAVEEEKEDVAEEEVGMLESTALEL